MRRRRTVVASMAAAAVVMSSLTATAAFAEGGITPPDGLAIEGTMKVGSTVSIPDTGWTPDASVLSVVWKADGDTIVEPAEKAGDLALDLTSAQVGKTISADVTAASDGFDPFSDTLTAAEPVAPGGFSATPVPVITGTPAVGSQLTVDAGTWTPAADFAYLWKAGEAVLSTDAAFTPAAAQLGQEVTVTVTGSADGYASASQTSAPVIVGAGTLTSQTPVISGDAVVGSTVTAESGTWSAGTVFSYAWTVDGAPVGDDSAQYVPVAADQGKPLAVAVTGTLAGYAPVTVSSDARKVAGALYTPTVAPSISGAARVDSLLTANPGTWPVDSSFTYVWTVGGATVAKGATFKPDAAHVGKTVVLTVVATAPGFEGSATAQATIGSGVFTTKPAPAISGTVRVGNKLTAKPGTWAPSATFTYTWKVSGSTVLSGTTATTFTPTAAQLGKGLVLTVKASRTGYSSVTQSTTSAKIGYGVFSAPTPKISGSAIVGKTLTVSTGTWTPSATKTYRWLRNGVSISGATGTSYKITSTDYGKKLSIRVTGKRTAYTTKSVTSASTATVVKPFTKTTAPTITGTARVASTLTAHRTDWSPTISTASYQWKRNGVAIPNATKYTYKLTLADKGKQITVVLTGKRSGYATTSRTSAATASVGGPIIGNGTYRVGVYISPGTYYTNAPAGCYWERRSTGGSDLDGVIANNFVYTSGRQIVTVDSSDAYFVTEDCGTWKPLSTAGEPATSVGNGVQAVGVTMEPGTYWNTGTGDSCYVALLSGFSGTLDDVIVNYYGDATDLEATVTGAIGFESWGCGTWYRVGD